MSDLKLLIDINVFLDVVLRRQTWLKDSQAVLDSIARGHAHGFVAGHAVTTLYYLIASANGRAAGNAAVADVLEICTVVSLDTSDFRRALTLGLKDFEDGVTATAAMTIGADYLVTRNETDFKNAPVVARSPAELLPFLPRAT